MIVDQPRTLNVLAKIKKIIIKKIEQFGNQ